jgi:PAS domain S-box-containing protein
VLADVSFAMDALESLPSGFLIVSDKGEVLYANPTFGTIVGQKSSHLTGKKFEELLSRGSAIFYETQFEPSLLLRGKFDEIALEVVTPAGIKVPILVNAIVQTDAETNVRQIHMSVFIAKQRKLYETELLRAKREYEEIAEIVRRSVDGIVRFSADGSIESWNNGAGQIFGYSVEESKNHSLGSLLPPEEAHAVIEALSQLRQGRDVYRETLALHRDGRLIDVSFSLTPFMEAPGTFVGFSAIIRDTTARKKTEKALLQNEKLAAVGRLASSVAHEINNPLEAVTNLLYIARASDNIEQIHSMLDAADAELRRVSNIANQTLRFHKQSSKPQSITCTDLFSAVLSMYEGKLRNSGIVVEKRKRADKPVVIYEGDIRQVLNNLIGNAIDAMPRGGRLIVRSRNACNWKSGELGIVLTVADTGSGIAPQEMPKIFEAFFTTKGINGTGLGLWISREIIDRHRGNLRIKSSQKEGYRGTVATIFLPIHDAIQVSLGAA